MEDPVIQYKSLDQANELIKNRTQGILTGYFESEDSPEYKTFSKVRKTRLYLTSENIKVAKALQEDCQFIAGFGDASAKERITGENILFKDKMSGSAVRRLTFQILSVKLFVSQLAKRYSLVHWPITI